MRIDALTPEERRREIAQLLGRALRRVLERTQPSDGAASATPPAGASPTCLSPQTERASEQVNDAKELQ